MLIGIDLGGTKIEAVALGENGETLARKRVATPRGDYGATIAAIAALVGETEAMAGLGPARAAGVGIPGSLSPATGLVRNANSTWLNGKPFDRDLAAALRRPVRVENDANCLAVSEAVDGAAAGDRLVFAVILGTGCGAGIAIDRRPLAGRNGVAGEFGHIALPWTRGEDEIPGPACWCGRRGCVETYLSGEGFSAAHARATGERLDPRAIVDAAALGEPSAQGSLSLYKDRLARSLAMVADVLDPDVFVLGGGLSNVEALYEGLTAKIAGHVFADAFDTPVRRALHGDSSGVRGAAWLWMD